MNPLSQFDHNEDELAIREYYQSFQVPDAAQREAILDRWQTAPLPPAVATPRTSRVRIAAVVVALLAVVAVSALREFRTPGTLYGADDLPARLVLVDNFRMTGWQNVSNPGGVNLPPTRLPFEIIVQRPGRYRHSINSISDDGKKQTIVTGYRMCDGQYEVMSNDSAKEFMRYPIGSLDAMLKTEQLAQGYAMLMVLGPAETNYVRVGSEPVNGIDCDLYVANFVEKQTFRLWINPRTGWPTRIVVESLNAAGKWSPNIEINEIDINGEMPETLFTYSPPEGYVDLISKHKPAPGHGPTASDSAVPSASQPPEISMEPMGTGSCNGQSLDLWNCFLLSPDTAIIAWKRTPPKAAEDGTVDWLSGIELVYQSGKTSRPVKHHWARPPQDKQWLWSIIKTTDGQPFGRGMIQMNFRSKGCNMSNSFVPLLFSDSTLDQLLQAADKSRPAEFAGEPLTLPSIRRRLPE